MTKEVQFRRGDSTAHSTFTGAAGEITINTDRNVPVVHNGTTAGGFEVVGLAATQTVTNKNLRVGTATSTGTASQPLQVVGGAYVSGNLGVGVTNPTEKIDIIGNIRLNSSAAERQVIFNNGSTNIYLYGQTVGAGGNIGMYDGTNTRGVFAYKPSVNTLELTPTVLVGTATSTGTASQPLQVTGGAYVSGSVGIGITNPTAKFEVNQGTSADANPELRVGGTGYIDFHNKLSAGAYNPITSVNDKGIIFTDGTVGTGNFVIAPWSASAGGIKIDSIGNVLVGAASSTGTASQRLQVNSGVYIANSVGIGTTNPTTTLDVGGEITVRRTNSTQEGGQITFTRAIDDANAYAIDVYNDVGLGLTAKLRFIDVVAGAERAAIDKSGNFLIGAGTSTGTQSQLLQVNSGGYFNGNVGIATTNPTAELHVVGPGTSTAGSAPIKVSAGSTFLLATPEEGAIEYDGTTFYATPNTSYGRAAVPLTLYTSGIGSVGTTLNTNYAFFPAANDTITLPIGTYLVRMRVRVAVTGSVVSSALNINLRGAGNAVGSFSWGGTGAILDAGAASSFIVAATALGTNITVTAASAANPRQYIALGEGILKVTTGGTIIPSYQYGATLTSGTTTLVADNYMIIQSLDTRSVTAFGPSGSGWG